jgi:hypothetical protein
VPSLRGQEKLTLPFYMLANEVIRRIWWFFCRGRSIHCRVRWPPDTWLIISAYHVMVCATSNPQAHCNISSFNFENTSAYGQNSSICVNDTCHKAHSPQKLTFSKYLFPPPPLHTHTHITIFGTSECYNKPKSGNLTSIS